MYCFTQCLYLAVQPLNLGVPHLRISADGKFEAALVTPDRIVPGTIRQLHMTVAIRVRAVEEQRCGVLVRWGPILINHLFVSSSEILCDSSGCVERHASTGFSIGLLLRTGCSTRRPWNQSIAGVVWTDERPNNAHDESGGTPETLFRFCRQVPVVSPLPRPNAVR